MSYLLYFCTIDSHGCLYVCYYVLTCSLCVVFLGQACVPYIDLLMCFLSLLYISGDMCAAVVEFMYYLKYGIVSMCVSFISYFYRFYKCDILPKYLNVCPSFLSL
jgi:hypothetical protein